MPNTPYPNCNVSLRKGNGNTASIFLSLSLSSEVLSNTDSILSVSDSSHTHTSRSGSTFTAVANTLSTSSRPVSTQTYVERSETEPISTASAQTYSDIAEAVSSEVSSTTHTHISRSGSTLTAVANSESSRPVSTQAYVKRNQTEFISRASAQTSAEIAKVTSTTDSILSVNDSSHTHTSRSVSTLTAVASTENELSRPVSTHAYVKRRETEPISTAYAQTYGETAEGRYGHLKIPLDKKIPWIVIRLISGVLLITAGVLVLLMLFIRN